MANDEQKDKGDNESQDQSVVEDQQITLEKVATEQNSETDQGVESEESTSSKEPPSEINHYKGHIAGFDKKNKTGILSTAKNNKSYYFEEDQWLEDNQPYSGCQVAFEAEELHKKYGKVVKMELIGEYTGPQGEPVKSRRLAIFLSILLGGVGAGRFYLGYWKLGIAQIAATVGTLGFAVVWGVLEGILLLMHRIDRDAQNRPLK